MSKKTKERTIAEAFVNDRFADGPDMVQFKKEMIEEVIKMLDAYREMILPHTYDGDV